MKKIGLYLLRCIVSYLIFLVVTAIIYSGVGFVKALQIAAFYTLGAISAELLMAIGKACYKIYKARRAKMAEKALKDAENEAENR